MTGNKFLNPLVKTMLCSAGMLVMGYFLYLSMMEETSYDTITVARALVFLGFTYLLVQSLREVLRSTGK